MAPSVKFLGSDLKVVNFSFFFLGPNKNVDFFLFSKMLQKKVVHIFLEESNSNNICTNAIINI